MDHLDDVDRPDQVEADHPVQVDHVASTHLDVMELVDHHKDVVDEVYWMKVVVVHGMDLSICLYHLLVHLSILVHLDVFHRDIPFHLLFFPFHTRNRNHCSEQQLVL